MIATLSEVGRLHTFGHTRGKNRTKHERRACRPHACMYSMYSYSMYSAAACQLVSGDEANRIVANATVICGRVQEVQTAGEVQGVAPTGAHA